MSNSNPFTVYEEQSTFLNSILLVKMKAVRTVPNL